MLLSVIGFTPSRCGRVEPKLTLRSVDDNLFFLAVAVFRVSSGLAGKLDLSGGVLALSYVRTGR